MWPSVHICPLICNYCSVGVWAEIVAICTIQTCMVITCGWCGLVCLPFQCDHKCMTLYCRDQIEHVTNKDLCCVFLLWHVSYKVAFCIGVLVSDDRVCIIIANRALNKVYCPVHLSRRHMLQQSHYCISIILSLSLSLFLPPTHTVTTATVAFSGMRWTF